VPIPSGWTYRLPPFGPAFQIPIPTPLRTDASEHWSMQSPIHCTSPHFQDQNSRPLERPIRYITRRLNTLEDVYKIGTFVRLLRLDTGAPSGYLDPYPQVFSEKNLYLDLQGSFPTGHLDPQVFYLQVTGQKILKVPAGIQ